MTDIRLLGPVLALPRRVESTERSERIAWRESVSLSRSRTSRTTLAPGCLPETRRPRRATWTG